jgi:hypothetical protein
MVAWAKRILMGKQKVLSPKSGKVVFAVIPPLTLTSKRPGVGVIVTQEAPVHLVVGNTETDQQVQAVA